MHRKLPADTFPVTKKLLIAFLLISACILWAQGQEPKPPLITEANWRQHPQISAVRSLVESTNKDSARGILKTSERKLSYCQPYEDTLRKLTVDSRGIARKYETQGGSEDSSLTIEHYYDPAAPCDLSSSPVGR